MASVSKAKTAVVLEALAEVVLVVVVLAVAVATAERGEREAKEAAQVAVGVAVVIAVVAAALMAIALMSTTTMVNSLEMVPLMVLAVDKVKTAKSTSCLITTHITPITIIGQLNADMRT